MGRIFTLLLLVTLLLIAAVGSFGHWISSSAIVSAKEDAAYEVAKSVSLSVSSQIYLLNKGLDKAAQRPEVIAAATSGNPAQVESVTREIRAYFPETMTIRLLTPDVSKTDESTVPHMGYADLDMVRETLTNSPSPVVQGDMGPNRHLAMTSQIVKDNKVVGVLLASLNYDFIAKTLYAADIQNHYIELKQDALVLGTSGKPLDKQHASSGELNVPRTAWKIHYEYSNQASLGEKTRVWGSLLVATLLAIVAYFFGYRKMSRLIKDDLSSILKAFKDIISHKSLGSYPVNLPEMNVVISSFLRLKRAMEGNDGEALQEEGEEEDSELEKSGFFSTPENFDLTDLPLDDMLFEDGTFTQETKQTTVPSSTPKTPVSDLVTDPRSIDFKEEKPKASPPAKPSHISPSIFKAYDIRGIVGSTLTMNMVYDIGRAFGTEAKNHGSKTVILGRDGRVSSPTLADELSKGIASTGCNVIDIGLVPTPTLYFAVQHIEGRSGIMVTGSHNPPDYNGFKMVIDGETLAESKIQSIKERIESRSYATGDMGLIEKNTKLANEYVGTIAEDIRIARPMLIVLDCGNGAGGKLGPILLRTLGCEVIELHCEIDGTFPNHHPDPSKSENMAELSTAVKHYKADLGLAFDGDADRLGVVDSNGKIIWPDRQMMLYAKNILSQKPGAEVIFDVKCSKHLPEQIKKFGGRPLMWKTGHSLMKAKIKETSAKLAGEMSGHIFFNDRWFGFDDALYASARLIEILSNESHSSAHVFSTFPDSINTPELLVQLDNTANSEHFMSELKAAADFANATIIDIDGIRVEFADGWGLVRASNTTPSLTLRFEADTTEALQRIQKQFSQLIHKIKPELNLPF